MISTEKWDKQKIKEAHDFIGVRVIYIHLFFLRTHILRFRLNNHLKGEIKTITS